MDWRGGMTYQLVAITDDLSTLLQLPGSVTSSRADTIEDAAFFSGPAPGHLHVVLARKEVSQTALRVGFATGWWSSGPCAN